jgi:hypothetical protein
MREWGLFFGAKSEELKAKGDELKTKGDERRATSQ